MKVRLSTKTTDASIIINDLDALPKSLESMYKLHKGFEAGEKIIEVEL